MIKSVPRDQAGFMLVPVMFIVLLFGGLAAAFLTEGLGDRTSLKHRATSMQALEIAEAGLHRAQLAIFHSPLDNDGTDDGIQTWTGTLGGGQYEVVAQKDPIYTHRWTLTSRGECRHSVRRIQVGIRRRQEGFFLEGLFSRLALDLNGDIKTDSFDSRGDPLATPPIPAGSWTSQINGGHGDSDPFGPFMNDEGSVGSNEGIVNGGSAAIIRGDSVPGPGYEVDLNGNPTILGDMEPRDFTVEFDPPPLTAFEGALTNMKNVIAPAVDGTADAPIAVPLAGRDPTNQQDLREIMRDIGFDDKALSLRPRGDVILNGGTYFFTDLVLGAQSTLTINGEVKIYVTGALDLTGGGLLNVSGSAPNCQIFAHPPTNPPLLDDAYDLVPQYTPRKSYVKITGGTEVAVAIYAPYVDVDVSGNSHLSGSVIGNTIDVSGTAYFHYDEALREVTADSQVMLERLFWRELSPAPR